jgi:hypothetical protein
MRKRRLNREISKMRVVAYLFVNVFAIEKSIFDLKRIDDIVCAKFSNFVLNRDEVLRDIIQK